MDTCSPQCNEGRLLSSRDDDGLFNAQYPQSCEVQLGVYHVQSGIFQVDGATIVFISVVK